MQISWILAAILAVPAISHAVPDANLVARADDKPEKKAQEVSYIAGTDPQWQVIIPKGQTKGGCVNSKMPKSKPKSDIYIPDGVMCEYWRAKDCPNAKLDDLNEHLGPYGNEHYGNGCGAYNQDSYNSGTFQIYDPQSYKCRYITDTDKPKKPQYLLNGKYHDATRCDGVV